LLVICPVLENPTSNGRIFNVLDGRVNEPKESVGIRGHHDGDYEECRLLGYKIPVLTSQETHYVSARESSRLMLSKI
jgi:hypothetical protein